MDIRVGFVAVSLSLAGCTTTNFGAGGLVNSGATAGASVLKADDGGRRRVAATIMASLDGGLIGGDIGRDLDDQERRTALEAEYRALEYTPGGQAVPWKVGRSDRYGEAVASQPYRVGSQDCRQYTQTVYAGGPARTVRGTACRNPDGGWTLLT